MAAAAVGNRQQQYWGANARQEGRMTYGRFIRAIPLEGMIDRTAVVTAAMSSGTMIGGGIGTLAGGAGAAPGAVIGMCVGFVAAVGGWVAVDYKQYSDYKATLNKEGQEALEEPLQRKLGNEEICPILHCVPSVPVRINGRPHTYEASALKEWIRKHGTNPMTREPCTLADIMVDYDQLAKNGKVCDEILNDPNERSQLSDIQLKGINVLRSQTLIIVEDVYNKSLNALIEEKKTRKISPREFAERVAKLAEFADPIIGEEAQANRT